MVPKQYLVSLVATVSTLCLVVGCGSDAEPDNEQSGDAEELSAGMAPPTSSNSLLIAFDGTGNVRPDNKKIFKDDSSNIYNLYASAVVNAPKESPPNEILNDGAKADTQYAYNFWKRFDSAGITKAIYFSGPPRPGLADTPWRDSGAKNILDAAFTNGVASPVCDAIRQSSIKNVYLIGYSRGAILAHEVAYRIGIQKKCGEEAAKKLKWVGLNDPVDTGMSAYKVGVEFCSLKLWGFSKGNGLQVPGFPVTPRVSGLCLKALSVPVLVMMKDGISNLSAANAWLASIPVNGSRVAEVQYPYEWNPSKVADVHINMGSKVNNAVIGALKASAKRSGLTM